MPGPSKAGFGLLRRESGFLIASLAASLPIASRSRSAAGNAEDMDRSPVYSTSTTMPTTFTLTEQEKRAYIILSDLFLDTDSRAHPI